jgi:biopolymer transport protein ExbB
MKTALATFASFLLAAPLMAQTAAKASVEEPAKAASLWQLAVSGGPMMIPLAALSVITVMLIVIFVFTLRKGAMVSGRYMQTADALIRKKDFLGLLAISNRHNEGVARIMRRTMDFLAKNPKATLAEAREIAQTEGVRQSASLNQQVAYLADIGAIAPMLGLLGTVIGIVQSFGVIAIDAAATRPTMLAHGIGEALVATATGLLVGIPAMMAYAYFRGRVQGMVSELESATTHLLAILSTVGTKGPTGGKDLL